FGSFGLRLPRFCGCGMRPSWLGAAAAALRSLRIPPSKSLRASISATTPNLLSSTGFDPSPPDESRIACRFCRRWPRVGARVRRAEAYPRPRSLSRGRLRKRLARGEAPGAQTFFQLGVAFGIRLCAEVGIRSLSLLGAFIRRLPGADHRLTLLTCLGRRSEEQQADGQRESEPVHPITSSMPPVGR